MSKEVTRTVFRKFKDGQILALFPYEKYDAFGLYCVSYMHIGQHSAADYSGMVAETTLAKPEEYASLKKELESIGYLIHPIKRASK